METPTPLGLAFFDWKVIYALRDQSASTCLALAHRAARLHPRASATPPPTPEPQDHAQYNFTDPESRIMKNSTNKGVDQHYNTQVAVDQDSLLIVAHTLSNHRNDQAEAIPTVDANLCDRRCVGRPDQRSAVSRGVVKRKGAGTHSRAKR